MGAEALEGLKNNNTAPRTSIDDVNSMNFGLSPEEQAAFDEQMSQRPSTGLLPQNAYYPGYNSNPAVGSYSGSEIGSTTLFAPNSALVPIGMMDARDLAVQKAALQRAKEVDMFKQQFKSPSSKLVNINEDLTNRYYEHVKGGWAQAMKAAKNDPNKAMAMIKSNPDFWAKEKSFQDLAKFGDDIVATKSRLDDEMKTGKFVAPSSLKETERQLFSVLQDPTSPKFKEFGNLYRRYKLESEFSQNINNMAKEIFKQKSGTAYDVGTPEFQKIYETTEEKYTPESIQYMKDQADAIYGDSEIYPKSYRDKVIEDFASGVQKTKKLQLVKKDKPEGLDVLVPFAPSDEVKNYNIKKSMKGAESVERTISALDAIPISVGFFIKPISSLRDKIMIVVSTGKPFTSTGTEEMTPVEIINIPWASDGSGIVTNEDFSQGVLISGEKGEISGKESNMKYAPVDPKKVEVRSTLVFKVPIKKEASLLNPDAKGEVEYKTVYAPAKEFQGLLSKKDANGKLIGGYDLDALEEKAKQRTAEIQKDKEPAKAEPAKKEIKESDIAAKAAAAGYSVNEYKKMLQQRGITITK